MAMGSLAMKTLKWMLCLAAAGFAAATAHAAGAAAPWRRIDNPPPVVGLDGKPHAATCSGFPGTDPNFRFWVRKGAPDKLAVVFNGGGACWDNLTCSHPARPNLPATVLEFYTAAIRPGDGPQGIGGALDATRADNPVKDHTVVFIPYCTGDLHGGSVTRTYGNAGHTVLALPSQFEIQHRGFDNFMVVLDWIARNVAPPRDLLVAGASAGGYGAIINFPWLAKLYPQARLSVLADASQGVSTAGFDSGLPGRGSWDLQLAPWVFGDTPQALRSGELMRAAALAYPAARFGQYTTTQDSVQSGFYGYMKLGYGPGGSCPRILPDWNQQMLATLASDGAALPNFRAYVAPGADHTILGSAAYYDTPTWGPRFADWLGALLVPGAGSWDNAACPDCLVPLPCRP
jgi:hypothetical protein